MFTNLFVQLSFTTYRIGTMHRTLLRHTLVALALASAQVRGAEAPAQTLASARDTAALMRRLRALAAETGGTVGVHALHLPSGQKVSLRGSEPFFMASVTKFPLAVHVLGEVERGRISLSDRVELPAAQNCPGRSAVPNAHPRTTRLTVEELLRLAVSNSDNPANDALQRVSGGAAAVRRGLESRGFRGILVERPYTRLCVELNRGANAADRRDTATPEAMTSLLAALGTGRLLNRANTARLLGWMTDSRNPATRIVAGVPAGTRVAHKTGTWDGPGGRGLYAVNDVGIFTLPDGRGELAVAIFVRSPERDMTVVQPAMARITRALFEHWTAPARR